MPLPFLAALGNFLTLLGGYVGGGVSAGLQAIGVGKFTAIAIGGFVSSGVYYGGQALVYVGLTAALTPPIPRPETGERNRKQTLPPRQYATGRVRLAGPYMLWEAQANKLYVVTALCDHRISAFVNFYLNDDKGQFGAATADLLGLDGSDVVLTFTGGDGRYGALASAERVKLLFREGLATETAYSEIVADLSADDIWTDDHRGDGIASMAMIAKHGELEDFPTHFPNGLDTQPSVVAETAFVPDPREPGFDPDDQTTWVYNANPVCGLMRHELVNMGADWDVVFAPTLDLWTAAMDVCDEQVSLLAGGTEDRYSHGAVYDSSNAPADVRQQYLACFDGWMGENGSGAKTIYAGQYVAPTIDPFKLVTDGGEIYEYSYQEFTEDERAVNELVISYTSPEHNYTEVEANPWRDDETYNAGRGRPEQLSLPWVQSPSQARRLAKRKMAKLKAAQWSITCNLAGLRALGHRFIPLEIVDGDFSLDAVGEVSNIEIDIMALRVTISGIIADTAVDNWTPAEEEGQAPPLPPRPPLDALTTPTIDALDAVPELVGTAEVGVRVIAQVTGPDRDDLSWSLRWRVAPAGNWTREETSDLAPDAPVVLQTGFLPVNTSIDIEVAYRTGGGAVSDWSATSTVLTTVTFDLPGTSLTTQPKHIEHADWTKWNATVDDDAAYAPDGTVEADSFIAAAGSSQKLTAQNFTVVAGNSYKYRAYFKQDTYRYAWIGDRGDSVVHCATVDMLTGAVVGTTNATATVLPSANGYVRVDLQFTRTGGGGTIASLAMGFGESPHFPDARNWNATGTEAFNIWNAHAVAV